MNKDKRKGSAIALALVFASAMFIIALGYSKKTQHAPKSTYTIDEHVRLQYLADGVSRIALLKFQMYSSEFYSAWEASNYAKPETKNDKPLEAFRANTGNKEFTSAKFENLKDQPKSIMSINTGDGADNNWIHIHLHSFELRNEVKESDETGAGSKWNTDVVTVTTVASYKTKAGKNLVATSTLSVISKKEEIKPW